MNWHIFLTLGALTLTACSGGSSDDETGDDDVSDVDSDGDGLSDAEEEELGLDPDSSDSDGDGLEDGDEIDQGLDPLSIDSDGDGYRDSDEITEGTDPLDDASVIYEGGWPYSATKGELNEADVPEIAEEGELFMNFRATDQFGQEFQLWDFKNDEGKYTVVDLSAEWCGPCQAVSSWLEGDYAAFDSEWLDVREAVDRGDVRWVTILGEDRFGDVANAAAVGRWHDAYPNPMIPIIPDNDYEVAFHAELAYWPTIIVLKDDMTVGWKGGNFATWSGGLNYVQRKL